MTVVIACTEEANDVATLARAERLLGRIQFETRPHKVIEMVRRGHAQTIVWDVQPQLISEIVAAVGELSGLGRSLLHVFRVELNRAGAHGIHQIAPVAPTHSVVSIRRVGGSSCDDLVFDIQRFASKPSHVGPEIVISRRIQKVRPRLIAVLQAAILLGKRRTYVSTLAAACECSVQTLRWRLDRDGAMSPSDLLRWTLTLHVVWRVGILGESVKQAAAATGYETPEALANRLARFWDERPTRLLDRGGFENWLDAFVTKLAAASSGN